MANTVNELSPNELAEWAVWNKNNWLIIASEYTETNPDLRGGVFDFSVRLWSTYPQRVEYLAKTNPRNHNELLFGAS